MEGSIMKYAKIENNIVIQTQPNNQPGFIEVDNSVVCGMIKNGSKFENPTVEPVIKTYRENRAEAYIKEMSPEGTFQNTVGDLLDSIIDFIESGTISTELQGLIDKRNEIKTRFPK
jgi:hypothetical protein